MRRQIQPGKDLMDAFAREDSVKILVDKKEITCEYCGGEDWKLWILGIHVCTRCRALLMPEE